MSINATDGITAQKIERIDVHAPGPVPDLPEPVRVAVPMGLSNLPAAEVFIGRGPELEQLAAAMQNGAGVVAQTISGLGGIGKTSLAAAYARRHGSGHAGIWWVTADSRAATEAGLADLTRRLWPQAAGHPDAAVLAQWALSWLGQHPGMLIVWDNVEDVEDVRDLIATLPQAAHLVTSRRAVGWHRIGVSAPLRLGPMEPDDATALLVSLADSDDPQASELCAELGFLPLAVEQAGAYLAEAGISARDYLTAWRDAQSAIAWAPEASQADRIMTSVWRTTLDRLADTPLAARVLGVMAWLASEQIPTDWLTDVLADAVAVREALRRLNAYSMITLRQDGTADVHRVVQAVTRTPGSDDPHRRPEAIAEAQQDAVDILAAHLPDGDPLNPQVTQRWHAVLPHIEAFATHVAGRTVPVTTIAVMDRAYEFWCVHGNRAAALQIAACLLAAQEHHQGLNHPYTVASRNNLANAYQEAGDLTRAIELYQANLAESKTILKPDHPNTLIFRNNLAHAYQVAGDLGSAIELYQANLSDFERILGLDHPNTLTARDNLASAYRANGNLSLAIPLYEATLTNRDRVLGPDHPDTLATHNNLAHAYHDAGDLTPATQLYRSTLAKRERVLGPDHPDTLISRNNLANAYQDAGDLAKALSLFEATLADSERVLGPDHPTTKLIRTNLGFAQSLRNHQPQSPVRPA